MGARRALGGVVNLRRHRYGSTSTRRLWRGQLNSSSLLRYSGAGLRHTSCAFTGILRRWSRRSPTCRCHSYLALGAVVDGGMVDAVVDGEDVDVVSPLGLGVVEVAAFCGIVVAA